MSEYFGLATIIAYIVVMIVLAVKEKSRILLYIGGGGLALVGIIFTLNNLAVLNTIDPDIETATALFKAGAIVVPVSWIVTGGLGILLAVFLTPKTVVHDFGEFGIRGLSPGRKFLYKANAVFSSITMFGIMLFGGYIVAEPNVATLFLGGIIERFVIAVDFESMLILLFAIVAIQQIHFLGKGILTAEWQKYRKSVNIFYLVTRYIMLFAIAPIFVLQLRGMPLEFPPFLFAVGAVGSYSIWCLLRGRFFSTDSIFSVSKNTVIALVFVIIGVFTTSLLSPIYLWIWNGSLIGKIFVIAAVASGGIGVGGGSETVKGTDGYTYISDNNGNYTDSRGKKYRRK